MHKKELNIKTSEIRRQVLEMIYKSKSSHIGSCFSIIDILTVLYFQVMNIKPSKPTSKTQKFQTIAFRKDVCITHL